MSKDRMTLKKLVLTLKNETNNQKEENFPYDELFEKLDLIAEWPIKQNIIQKICLWIVSWIAAIFYYFFPGKKRQNHSNIIIKNSNIEAIIDDILKKINDIKPLRFSKSEQLKEEILTVRKLLKRIKQIYRAQPEMIKMSSEEKLENTNNIEYQNRPGLHQNSSRADVSQPLSSYSNIQNFAVVKKNSQTHFTQPVEFNQNLFNYKITELLRNAKEELNNDSDISTTIRNKAFKALGNLRGLIASYDTSDEWESKYRKLKKCIIRAFHPDRYIKTNDINTLNSAARVVAIVNSIVFPKIDRMLEAVKTGKPLTIDEEEYNDILAQMRTNLDELAAEQKKTRDFHEQANKLLDKFNDLLDEMDIKLKTLDKASIKLIKDLVDLSTKFQGLTTDYKGILSRVNAQDPKLERIHQDRNKIAKDQKSLGEFYEQISEGCSQLKAGYNQMDIAHNQLKAGYNQMDIARNQLKAGHSQIREDQKNMRQNLESMGKVAKKTQEYMQMKKGDWVEVDQLMDETHKTHKTVDTEITEMSNTSTDFDNLNAIMNRLEANDFNNALPENQKGATPKSDIDIHSNNLEPIGRLPNAIDESLSTSISTNSASFMYSSHELATQNQADEAQQTNVITDIASAIFHGTFFGM
jgi:uncharacterized protein YoxC